MPGLIRKMPLHISHPQGSTPSVMLGEVELAGVIAAHGLSIEYVDDGFGSVPKVTMIFGPGSLELDFDVDLLERLLSDAKARQ